MEDKQVQAGTGSAENKGGDRQEQVTPTKDMSQQDKQQIAREIDVPADKVASVQDTGMLSGRDDLAGGDNDGMQDENTGSATDR